MKKILFIKQHVANAKFVTNDIDMLKENYSVTVQNVKVTKKLSSLFYLLTQFIYLLFNSFRYDLFYIWFADYHSYLPVLFSRFFSVKCIICAGGYEATWISEINMGVYTDESFSKRLRRFCVTYSLKHCDYILPVDDSLILNENKYIYSNRPGQPVLKDGIKHFIPDIKTKFRTIAPGYDSEIFKRKTNIQKERAVICVGYAPNENEIRRKGFDVLTECAKAMRDVKFILVGLTAEFIERYKSMNIPNLELRGKVSYDELIELYSRTKVYAQLSLFEGLPSTICEAMLCECVPVGSNVNGIPGIIKDTGYIVNKKDLTEITEKIKIALESKDDLGLKARENIKLNFSFEKRMKAVNRVAAELLSPRRP